MKPFKESLQLRLRLLLTLCVSFFRCLVADHFLYFIEHPDPRHCLISGCLFQLLFCEVLFQYCQGFVEPAPCMCHASGYRDPFRKTVVCLVTIAGEVPSELISEELCRMITGTCPLILEENHPRGAAEFICEI